MVILYVLFWGVYVFFALALATGCTKDEPSILDTATASSSDPVSDTGAEEVSIQEDNTLLWETTPHALMDVRTEEKGKGLLFFGG